MRTINLVVCVGLFAVVSVCCAHSYADVASVDVRADVRCNQRGLRVLYGAPFHSIHGH